MAKKDTWTSLLSGHLMAFVFCVAFPGFVTAIAPVSWVSFQRQGDKVTAKADICLFFLVPYKSKTVDPVVGIDDRFVAGEQVRQRGNRHSHKSEDEGFLVIHGEEQSVEVPVTPFNVKSVTKRAQDFLADPQAKQLKMTVVANWKFSVFGGGLVSLLTVLYVVGMTLSFFRFILRIVGLSNDNNSMSPPITEKTSR